MRLSAKDCPDVSYNAFPMAPSKLQSSQSYKWQMSFIVSKCGILSIHHKRTPPTLNSFGNTLLNVVNSHSYLGVTVFSDLRWHEHVNSVSSKATKTLNFIRRNVYCCPPDAKATAYISLVRPHLEYAAAAWDPYLVGECKQLEKVQRRAARFLKRDYRSTTYVAVLQRGMSQNEAVGTCTGEACPSCRSLLRRIASHC